MRRRCFDDFFFSLPVGYRGGSRGRGEEVPTDLYFARAGRKSCCVQRSTRDLGLFYAFFRDTLCARVSAMM